jgi:hypothetical protein
LQEEFLILVAIISCGPHASYVNEIMPQDDSSDAI